MWSYALLFLLIILISALKNTIKDCRLHGWIDKKYCFGFKGLIPKQQKLIDKGEEIPSDTPALLIIGGFRTQSRLIKIIDFFAGLIPFGWLRFNMIIPEGYPVDLVLFFKNISKDDSLITDRESEFEIIYPNNPIPVRGWPIRIPHLNPKNTQCDNKVEYSKSFFTPEISGTHELRIKGFKDLRYIGPHGVAGRKYSVSDPGAYWRVNFNVSSLYEIKVFIIAFTALILSLLNLLYSFLDKIGFI
ncbi:MAG: hypothetical protein JRC68_05030 [Deltaproteobacteria bacterium]|nr:hypothetical protein [Deltaproteobacteria bacterium]